MNTENLRGGYTDISKQLIERANVAGSGANLLRLFIGEAFKASGMDESDSYFIRVGVYEMPAPRDTDGGMDGPDGY